MTVSIVERLNRQVLLRITPEEGVVHGPINPDGPEAASLITEAIEALDGVRGYWPHLVAGLRCYPEAKANVQDTLDAIEDELRALSSLKEGAGR
jgi:hypothetical protein